MAMSCGREVSPVIASPSILPESNKRSDDGTGEGQAAFKPALPA